MHSNDAREGINAKRLKPFLTIWPHHAAIYRTKKQSRHCHAMVPPLVVALPVVVVPVPVVVSLPVVGVPPVVVMPAPVVPIPVLVPVGMVVV